MNDEVTIAVVILNSPGAVFSVRRLLRNKVLKAWGEEKLQASLESLAEKGGLEKLEGRYSANHCALFALLEKEGIENAAIAYESLLSAASLSSEASETPKSQEAQETQEASETSIEDLKAMLDSAPDQTAPQPSEPKSVKPKLANPKITSGSKLDALLSKISSLAAEKIYEGSEREDAKNDAFEKAVEVVTRVNEGIKMLAQKSTIVHNTDLVSIKRVLPVGNGVGGIEMTAHGRILFRRPWSDKITDHWLKKLQKDVERSAVGTLEGLANRVAKAVRK